MRTGPHVNYRYNCLTLVKLEFSQQIFKKNVEFYADGRTDRHNKAFHNLRRCLIMHLHYTQQFIPIDAHHRSICSTTRFSLFHHWPSRNILVASEKFSLSPKWRNLNYSTSAGVQIMRLRILLQQQASLN